MSNELFSEMSAIGVEISTNPVLSLISVIFAIGIVYILIFWGMRKW